MHSTDRRASRRSSFPNCSTSAAAYFDDPAEARKRLVLQSPAATVRPRARRRRAPRALRRGMERRARNDARRESRCPLSSASPLSARRQTRRRRRPSTTARCAAFSSIRPRIVPARTSRASGSTRTRRTSPRPNRSCPPMRSSVSACSSRVYDALLADAAIDETALCRRLQAEARASARRRGPAAAARNRCARRGRSRAPCTRRAWASVRALPFELALGDVRARRHARRRRRCARDPRARSARSSARNVVRWHLDALVLAALGDPRPVLTFANFEPGDIGPRALAAHAPEAARAALRWLVGVCAGRPRRTVAVPAGAAWAWLEAIRERRQRAADEVAAEAVDEPQRRRRGHRRLQRCSRCAVQCRSRDASATLAFRAWDGSTSSRRCRRARAGARGGMTTPLLDWPLEGTHRIEASAGTGKTFALALLHTRLVVERELPVRKHPRGHLHDRRDAGACANACARQLVRAAELAPLDRDRAARSACERRRGDRDHGRRTRAAARDGVRARARRAPAPRGRRDRPCADPHDPRVLPARAVRSRARQRRAAAVATEFVTSERALHDEIALRHLAPLHARGRHGRAARIAVEDRPICSRRTCASCSSPKLLLPARCGARSPKRSPRRSSRSSHGRRCATHAGAMARLPATHR